jgi:hypothetical protein
MTAISDEVTIPSFEPGDVVRVRTEPSLSAVVLPTHQGSQPSEDGPDLGASCCVPVVLVRTPADNEDGVKRWVEIRDLTPMEPD